MGERAKVILNEYSARDLLKRDTLDLDKFYTADLKLFVEVARKEIERLNKTIQVARNNILSDISMIKNEKMSKEEIINRLQSTLSLIVGSDKE